MSKRALGRVADTALQVGTSLLLLGLL
jgi:hypothetical protein